MVVKIPNLGALLPAAKSNQNANRFANNNLNRGAFSNEDRPSSQHA
jgi:hypothetical protein